MIKYNMHYNKNDKKYHVYKNVIKKNVCMAFKSIYSGSRYLCNKFIKENNITID